MDLQGLFGKLNPAGDPRLLVGIDTMDDAGVYKINDDQALVVTVDYITPVIDDPLWFGRVAAANAISDIYAMGGKPITALNLCNFPGEGIELDDLAQILKGGEEKIREAGAVLAGGHTVRDAELKYGLSVNGLVHPDKVTSNAGASVGDKFILTKPLGTGVHIAASKKGTIDWDIMGPVVETMATLNKVASEVMVEFGSRCATDITGFGLAGHSLSMAKASSVGIRFYFDALPRFPKSLDLIGDGMKTGVTGSNLEMVEANLRFDGEFTDTEKTLFVDPQTSGGLFISVAAEKADDMVKTLLSRGVTEAKIVAEAYSTENPGLEVVRT